jgi:oxygen-dependent protoporphyrinogen oxidase
MRPRIAIIGGGISGLAAANRLLELDPSVDLLVLEAADRLGGVLQTTHRDGFLMEGGPDGFLTTVPWGVDFAQRVGCDLVPTEPSGQRAYVVHHAGLHSIPSGFIVMAPTRFLPVLRSRLLSMRGKIRLGWEYFVPRTSSEDDESLAAFAKRRLGREAYERIVQPLVGGIYSGDPERLSLAATMPRFKEMERKHGSLLRAMRLEPPARSESSGARYSQFVAPQGGMSCLIKGAAKRIPPQSIRLKTPVAAVQPLECGAWRLEIQGPTPGTLTADGLIFAAPAFETARLLARTAPSASIELSNIAYASCALVSLAYRREQIPHALDAFGFVVPRIEDRLILSCSFSSLKYPGRAPDGTVLLRVFVGGALQGQLLRLSDDDLVEISRFELGQLLGVCGEPLLTDVQRRTRALPQYYVGHCDRVRRIEAALAQHRSLALAGNLLRGVGIPHCIQSGEQAADRVLQGVYQESVSGPAIFNRRRTPQHVGS